MSENSVQVACSVAEGTWANMSYVNTAWIAGLPMSAYVSNTETRPLGLCVRKMAPGQTFHELITTSAWNHPSSVA